MIYEKFDGYVDAERRMRQLMWNAHDQNRRIEFKMKVSGRYFELGWLMDSPHLNLTEQLERKCGALPVEVCTHQRQEARRAILSLQQELDELQNEDF